MEQADRIRMIDALSTIRCGAAQEETQLHVQVGDALEGAGFVVQHEARLAPRCRIDFLVGDVGIEIKKNRPVRAALIRQLSRYAQCEQIGELLVIAPRGVNLPKRIEGKAVRMLPLERLWGISLP